MASLQQGVGMVEILVTVFVLAVGLLGVASLQFVGTFTNTDALNRSQSVLIAQQLAERLRAGSAMSSQGNGLVVSNTYFEEDIYNFSNLSCEAEITDFACYCLTIPATIPDCTSTTCSADEFAEFDAYEMSCAIEANNPNVHISVSCDDNNDLDDESCSAGSRHTILLRWPADNWRDQSRALNSECNVGVTDPYDCVVLDVTL